jgi:hypothetical protein
LKRCSLAIHKTVQDLLLWIVLGVLGVLGAVAANVQDRRIGTALLSPKQRMVACLVKMGLQLRPWVATHEHAMLHLSAHGVCGKRGQVVQRSVVQADVHVNEN